MINSCLALFCTKCNNKIFLQIGIILFKKNVAVLKRDKLIIMFKVLVKVT